MNEGDSFFVLMEKLRSGEGDAAREVFQRFSRQLVALARAHLAGVMARKVDPEDVVQSAYKSFFLRQREGKLQVGDWKSLWGLLTLITLRKCADQVAHFRAERRDVRREVHNQGDEQAPWELFIGRDPSPQEAAILSETVQGLFRELDEDERPILELSLQGYNAVEIGDQLGRAERSVRRLRERIRKKLEKM